MASSAEPLLSCEALDCGYPDRPVLSGVGFRIAAGEAVALLGPNGSGKSTLLKTIAKSLPPLAGSVRIHGVPLADLGYRDLARRAAYVPQQEQPAFDFTVREIVLMGRMGHSEGLFETPEDHAAAQRAMESADCAFLADRPFSELSGGEAQRALIARALAQEAPLLLLDEPTAHLDVGHQVAIVGLVRKLAAQGFGVLVAAHDLNLAAALATRALVLCQGRLALDAPLPDALFSAEVAAAFGVGFEQARTDRGAVRVFPSGLFREEDLRA